MRCNTYNLWFSSKMCSPSGAYLMDPIAITHHKKVQNQYTHHRWVDRPIRPLGGLQRGSNGYRWVGSSGYSDCSTHWWKGAPVTATSAEVAMSYSIRLGPWGVDKLDHLFQDDCTSLALLGSLGCTGVDQS